MMGARQGGAGCRRNRRPPHSISMRPASLTVGMLGKPSVLARFFQASVHICRSPLLLYGSTRSGPSKESRACGGPSTAISQMALSSACSASLTRTAPRGQHGDEVRATCQATSALACWRTRLVVRRSPSLGAGLGHRGFENLVQSIEQPRVVVLAGPAVRSG